MGKKQHVQEKQQKNCYDQPQEIMNQLDAQIQPKQNLSQVVAEILPNQSKKIKKSNQKTAMLSIPQKKQNQNLKRYKKLSNIENKKQSKKNIVQKKQTDRQQEQKTQKNGLHEDPKLFSRKYQIRKLPTYKGTRASNQSEILDISLKPLSIMCWNIGEKPHERQNSSREDRYNTIIKIIVEKSPDIVNLQETQMFRKEVHFMNFLKTLVGSSYYYSSPSLSSTIILCKTKAKFYELSFAKGLKTKPMSICTLDMKCPGNKTLSVVVHSVHLKFRVQQVPQVANQLQLRTIQKINKKFDINIMAGDFSFDDKQQENTEVSFGYLDLGLHYMDKSRRDLLPAENRCIGPQSEMESLGQMIEEGSGNVADEYMGEESDGQSGNMGGQFEPEDQFDGYSGSWDGSEDEGERQDDDEIQDQSQDEDLIEDEDSYEDSSSDDSDCSDLYEDEEEDQFSQDDQMDEQESSEENQESQNSDDLSDLHEYEDYDEEQIQRARIIRNVRKAEEKQQQKQRRQFQRSQRRTQRLIASTRKREKQEERRRFYRLQRGVQKEIQMLRKRHERRQEREKQRIAEKQAIFSCSFLVFMNSHIFKKSSCLKISQNIGSVQYTGTLYRVPGQLYNQVPEEIQPNIYFVPIYEQKKPEEENQCCQFLGSGGVHDVRRFPNCCDTFKLLGSICQGALELRYLMS